MQLNRVELCKQLGATFDYQIDVIKCMDKFRTVVKPRQAGMTTAFAIEALVDAIINDNYVVCMVSPTSRQSKRMMRYVKKALRKLEKSLKIVVPTQKFTGEEVYFHHGSEIHSLPNNPLGIQGIDCDHGIVDEAGLFPANEGEAIMDALVGSLAAKGGRLTVSGKPKGKRGMLWQFWDKSNPRYNEFAHFQITWEDRARQDPLYKEEVAAHKKILSKLQFDETYNALFIDEGVLIYPHSLLESSQELWKVGNFVLMSPEGAPDKECIYYAGVDFGRKVNKTEIHILKKEPDGLLRTLSMKTFENTNFEVQKVWIDEMMTRMNISTMKIDERGMGLALLDHFQAKWGESRVQPLKLTNGQTKERVILQLRDYFTDLKLAIPYNNDLYEQLHNYQKEYTDQGNVRYFGKVDETDFQDDKVIALAAAVDASKSGAFNFGVA